MDERLRFVARLLEGESMSDVCREFGISRKTGYKIFARYKDHGIEALTDRSRRPVRYANQLPGADRGPDRHPQAREAALGRTQDPRAAGAPIGWRRPDPRQEHHPRRVASARSGQRPSAGHAIAPLARRCPPALRPTSLWCADFKGEFKLGNGHYCYPLTVTDHASRYLLLCEALDSTREDPAITAFEQLFLERGLPGAIRSDNGVPFASPNALFNLSKLSVWWLRLGIAIERIKPGHPQQNGRHERMHLTLKKEATRPPGMNSLQQQARFDAFVQRVQHRAAARGAGHEDARRGVLGLTATLSWLARTDLPACTIAMSSSPLAAASACTARRINISTVLAGQRVGIKEVDEGIWIVSFMHYDLGYIDLEQKTLQPLDNPFGARLLPMS